MAAEPIDESGFVRIGRIDQWISIQGHDQSNPVILYLHGGPAEAQSPFLKEFLPWQRDFTVVNWDQRGCGKTFGRHGFATPDMTFDRLVDDAVEIAEHVRTRFSQRKVILVGQSCGSLLGVHAIKRRPDMFHAYVGTGQVVSINATMAELAQWAHQKATETADTITLEALDKAASLPDPDRQMALRRASGKWAISAPDQPYVKMVTDFKRPKPYPATGDVADWINGVGFTSSGNVARTMISTDLHTLGLDMPIPFFVVQGREDQIAGIEPARAYVERLRAPAKAFVPIDGGHYACFTNANGFIATLRRNVRPLAV
jgi:pimeloyl-ACP methyl ester carboxylesterase